MSHFVVLVIGDDVEQQLAPYHEYECTSENDQYVQDVDVTDELQQRIDKGESVEEALSWHGLDDRTVSDISQVDVQSSSHKFGYAIVKDDKLIKAVNRTNPNAQWDWYEIGGRWTGYFPLKKGCTGDVGSLGVMTEEAEEGYADSVSLKAVDIDKARQEMRDQANTLYDEWEEIITQHGFPRSWDQVRSDHGDDIDAAREAYHAQDAVAAMSKHGINDLVDTLGNSRAAYVTKRENAALVPYAIVKDGKWHARGTMGWWGMSNNEVDATHWDKEFHQLLSNLSPDTLLTIVDCHI